MTKTIIDEYLFYQEKYTKQYGNKTIVFMMIGGFYEAYATDTRGFDLSKISEITNLVKTKRDKKVETVDEKNPYMVGFNNAALDKFLKILVDNEFTVVIIDQVTAPPNPKRAVTGIYSAGTYDSNSIDSNNIVSLYIEDEKQVNGTYLSCCGLSVVDLTTGECIVYETFPTMDDVKYSLDETYRFILSHHPKEVIITRKEIDGVSLKKDTLLSYLELENKLVHYNNQVNKNYSKLSFQNDFFKTVYGDKKMGMMSSIEYLNMEKMPYARTSFIVLLDFVHKHNENFVKNLDVPTIFYSNKHLILGNNAIYQLNIFENNSIETKNMKYKCFFDVVNSTSTAMGRRFLKNAICNPLNDSTEIQLRYNCVEEMIKDDLFLQVEELLNYVLDIEKMSRKISLATVQPYELANLVESYNEIGNIYKLLKEHTVYSRKFIPHKRILEQIKGFLDASSKIFNSVELKKTNMSDISGSFFNKGIYPDIDDLNAKVVTNIQAIEEVCKVLSGYIDDNSKFAKEGDSKIQLKKNDRDGYYLNLTKRRADILYNKIKNLDSIKINDTLTINPKKLEFKHLDKGYSKIFFNDLDCKSSNVIQIKEKMVHMIKKKYLEVLLQFGTSYREMFRTVPQSIAKIDYIKCNSKNAKKYGYNKPVIVENDNNGFVSAKQLRHPIAERLITDVEYIPHDIQLGKDGDGDGNRMDGMLLFGINSSGKTTLMKAIGLNVIMAQCGMYVAASSFRYSLYDSLFARITANDNIFKGQSLFTLEMTELDAIIKRAGAKTLVIGDEICRGTEHVSGNSIVGATLVYLSRSNCSFIFATHLHEMAQLTKIQELKNVKMFHLTVEYDKANDRLIFDRQLKPGSGDSIYGLTVAKYIIKNTEFMKLAQEFKNELLDKPNELMTDKQSKYNANVYVDCCQICGKRNGVKDDKTAVLDVHHINFQSNCSADGFIIGKSYIPMNTKCNLIVLCKKCHVDTHQGKILIRGYKQTSEGRVVDYTIVNKKVAPKTAL